MNCERCGFYQSVLDAETILIEHEQAFSKESYRAKLAEIAVEKAIFATSSTECKGPDDEGKCGSAYRINDTRNTLHRAPGITFNAKFENSAASNTTGQTT